MFNREKFIFLFFGTLNYNEVFQLVPSFSEKTINFLGFNSKTAIPMLASRGCPYSCFNYCTYPLQQGRKVRLRSVQNIVSEIKHWIKVVKTNKFVFRDPVFSINSILNPIETLWFSDLFLVTRWSNQVGNVKNILFSGVYSQKISKGPSWNGFLEYRKTRFPDPSGTFK